MNKHLKYLKYLIRHKWFVFVACRKCGVSIWRAIIHDWHKFLPDEWFPYANYFYGKNIKWSDLAGDQKNHVAYSDTEEYWKSRFNHAWNLHQKRARHHWQFWVLINDNDHLKYCQLDIPEKYLREMVADWWGAGKAITGNWDALSWYHTNKDEILVSDSTRNRVEDLLKLSSVNFETPKSLRKRAAIIGC